MPLVLRALLHIFPTQNCHFFRKSPLFALNVMQNDPVASKPTFFQRKNNMFDPVASKGTHTNKQSHKQKGKRRKPRSHTHIQSNKRSINQTNSKQKRKNPKETTLYKNLATPDRPPPAAAMFKHPLVSLRIARSLIMHPPCLFTYSSNLKRPLSLYV